MPAPAVSASATSTGPLLAVDGLHKLYPVRQVGLHGLRRRQRSLLHAIDGVGFAIEHGETVGLVGESGCGKSTLSRIVARLLDPTAGSIRFAGNEIGAVSARKFGRSRWRTDIQMVFQDAADSLNPRFTAARAIADPLIRLRGLSGTPLRAKIEEAARLTGLPAELLSRFPHQLSGGQKARVGIARAIAVEPRLLILDEPTSALDVSVQMVILKLLHELRQRLALSYLFVSHDLNVVRLLCDRVLVMYLGRIIESGPAWRVFAAPAHPYTQALLSAIPQPGARRTRIALAGEPQSPIDPDPQICRLFGRCSRATALCRSSAPQLRPIAPGQFVACHHAAVESDEPSTAPVPVAVTS